MSLNVNSQGNVVIEGSLAVSAGISGQNRTGITSENSAVYPLELQLFRIWDAFQTPLGTAGADDLGITAGAFATGAPYIHSGDLNTLGAFTRYARALFTLPVEYVATGAASIRFWGGMLTAVASVSSTVDVEIYKSDKDGTIGGSDLVATAATSINSTSVLSKDFALTVSSLNPGDQLDIRVALIGNSATASSHFAILPSIEMLLTVKG